MRENGLVPRAPSPSRPLAALALLVALVPARSAAAQAVSFDEAIGLSLDAPLVRGEARALEARRAGDGRISDTTEPSRLSLTPGARVLSEADRGFEGQLAIGHAWNLEGLADAQRRSARSEREALGVALRARALEQRLAAALAWLNLREAELHREAADEARALAERLLERARRASRAGVATAADEAEALAFLSEARAALLAVHEEIVDAQVELGAALGRGDVETLRTEGPLPTPALPSAPEIERRLAERARVPSVELERLRAVAARAREVEHAAARGARLDAELIVSRESPSGLIVFGQVGLSVPLADLAARERALDREQATLHESRAEEAALAWRREAHRVAHEVEHATATLASYREELLPALEALVQVRERQLAVGETTSFYVLDASRRLAAVRAALAEAETRAAWTTSRAWLLLALDAEGEGAER